jgi:tyrosyl-tRNA synthetase
MNHLLQELRWRGFVHDTTPQLSAHLDQGPAVVYCGFDPTAPSLQVGNLVPLMLLAHFQRAGHRPIALMGGGTGLIGDPSGQRTERPLLSREQIGEHLRRMRDQAAGFLDFDPGPTQALVLDNAKWLEASKLIDFLRDVGKHFTINVMLQKESVKARLEAGISYTEFSYMLLQAYDFLTLYRTQQCTVQVGGSDQWGNITAGVDLIRKVVDGSAHGLVSPLITTSTGAKFGKSAAGTAIFLDPALTSPYKFYQFWVNVDDRDAVDYLKLFTLMSKDEIETTAARAKKDPAAREAQLALARDLTKRVHGSTVATSVERASQVLFGDFDPRSADAGALEVLSREIPTVQQATGVALADAVVAAGLAKSKSEARRAIEQGGLYVNQQRVTDEKKTIAPGDLLAGGFVLLRKGRKDYALIKTS